MLDLLNETIEKPVIFSHEAQVLDLAFQRWVCTAFVDTWRDEVLGALSVTEPNSPNSISSISGNYQYAKFITELSVSHLLFYKFRQYRKSQVNRHCSLIRLHQLRNGNGTTQLSGYLFVEFTLDRPARNLSRFGEFSVWTVHSSGLPRTQSRVEDRGKKSNGLQLAAPKMLLFYANMKRES